MSSKPQLRIVGSGGDPAPAERAAAEHAAALPESDSELFERFAPYVARIGLRLLGRESDVDDLIQDVFIAAMRQRHQVREPAAFKSWLAIITVRTARRYLRKRKLRSMVGFDTLPPPLELRDTGMSPERRALLSRVYRVLEKLPVDQRIAWTLRYVEGEKLEEVAVRCNCSLATAKRRIAAAHGRLEAELDDG